MIDSIKFSLNKEYYNKNQIIELFERKLNFKSETKYNHGVSENRSYLNWKFWLTENNLNFTGSLTNLILSNNVENPTFDDINKALSKLEEILEIPLEKARVTRIDISRTIDLDYEISKYLEIMLPPKNYKTVVYGNYETLYLVNDKVASTKFYDKVEEDKKKHKRKTTIVTPHKLRLELHVPNNVSKFFKIPELTFGDLRDKAVYVDLIGQWYRNYLNIPTKKKYTASSLRLTSLSKFRNSVAMEGISARGGVAAIDAELRKSTVNKKVRLDIRRYVNQNFKEQPVESYLKKELDEKMKEIYQGVIID